MYGSALRDTTTHEGGGKGFSMPVCGWVSHSFGNSHTSQISVESIGRFFFCRIRRIGIIPMSKTRKLSGQPLSLNVLQENFDKRDNL
jgi:hypothetical protein